MDASKPGYDSLLPLHERPETPQNHRQCSVRGCTHPVAEGSTNKMCDVCRSRHRVYASTKRARRKLEKAAVANASAVQNGLESIVIDSAHEIDSISTTIATSWGSENPESFKEELSPTRHQQSGVSEPNPMSAASFKNWGAIDPRLFASHLATSSTQHVHPHQSTSSSELANALTLPLPRQATPSQAGFAPQNDTQDQEMQTFEEQPLSESAASDSGGGSTRFCSVKGCKAVVPATYKFKMCPPCRTRYRTYGVTKRAKWKSERHSFDHKMAALRISEDERRASKGLPPLADSPEELRAWKASILEEQAPPSEETSSHSQSLTPSTEPETDPDPPPMESTLPFGYVSSNNIIAGVYPATLDSISTPYPVSVSSYVPMDNHLVPMIGPHLPARMCTVSHCHKILPGYYRFKRCEQHRVQNRHHSKLKRFREKVVKALGPEDGATVLDSALFVDADDDANGDDDDADDSGSANVSGTSKQEGKEKAAERLGLLASHDSTDLFASQQNDLPTKPKGTGVKSREERQKRSKYSCANDECHNLLTPGVRWRTCDECRNEDRLRKQAARAALIASENFTDHSNDLSSGTPEAMKGNIVSITPQSVANVVQNPSFLVCENDEEDAEGDPDIDSAGEDLQTMQPQPQSEPKAPTAISPITDTNAVADININIITATSIQELNSIHRRHPKIDPNSPTFNSLTKQKLVNDDSSRSVKGAFSKFRVDLVPSSSAKKGPIYSGFIPKTGSNLVQANSVSVSVERENTVCPEVSDDKEFVKVDSVSQPKVQLAEHKAVEPVVTVCANTTPQSLTSGLSVPTPCKEPDKLPTPPPPSAAAPPPSQKKKASKKGKKTAANNASTPPVQAMAFGPYGFPNSYPYYPYFMPTFPYTAVPPMNKNNATLTTQPGPSSSSSSRAQTSATQVSVPVPPQYLPYPFLPPPPPPHVAQAYGFGLAPSAYPYLPPRYTVPNQNLISGQQPYPTFPSQFLPTPPPLPIKTQKTKTSTSSSVATSTQPSLTSSSIKISESNSSSVSAREGSSAATEPKQDQAPTVTAATDPPPFTHYHEFDSGASLLGDNNRPVKKRRKVDPNYLEKYRAIHGFDPPTATPSPSVTVPVMPLNESLQGLNVNFHPAVELPNSQVTTKPCTRNGCHRTVSQGTLCERCKLKFKKHQAKVKRKHKLEPQPLLVTKD